MFKRTRLILTMIAALGALATTSCSSSSSGGSSAAETYTLSGNLDPGNSTSSFSTKMTDAELVKLFDLTQSAKTQCADGFYYSVYCVAFTTPPVSAEGDVNCSGNGAFSVAGLPLNQAVGCFIRRYESDSATTSTSVGSIEIPASNLNGKTDSLVAAGDVELNIAIGSSGTITATVVSGGDNLDTDGSSNATSDALFTADNINGAWVLSCDSTNGSSEFSPGHCKCFLGDDQYGAAGYSNQDECLDDSNGPGAALGAVSLDIGMYIYEATANADIPTENGQSIASGTELKAISIWGGTSKGAGGEGVTNLGGSLTWGTTPLDPAAAIAWSTGAVTVKDGLNASKTFTIPAFPATPNVMTHSQWMTWAQDVATAAQGQAFACTRGPNDAEAHNDTGGTSLDLAKNIECINQVLNAFEDESADTNLPILHIRPFCDNMGCYISNDATDNANNYFHANTMNTARVEIRGWHMAYPAENTWVIGDDFSATGPATGLDAGIGIEPSRRFVFEPLILYPNGAGFRQGDDQERHYECLNSGGSVTNAACTGGGFFELVCHSTEELSIKFLGTGSPFDVVFDTVKSVVSARLWRHNGGPATEVTPTGTNVIAMCQSASGGGAAIFMAKGTKQ